MSVSLEASNQTDFEDYESIQTEDLQDILAFIVIHFVNIVFLWCEFVNNIINNKKIKF